MAQIKKAFAEIVELLQANENSKVKSVLPQIIELASAKSGGGGGGATTFHKNADGKVVAIRCFYHKKWMSPEVVEFGAKANTATGFNTMCKTGVSNWTKQQREAKNAKDVLLAGIADGSVPHTELAERLQAIEDARNLVVDREDGYGFETLEECLADNEARGVSF